MVKKSYNKKPLYFLIPFLLIVQYQCDVFRAPIRDFKLVGVMEDTVYYMMLKGCEENSRLDLYCWSALDEKTHLVEKDVCDYTLLTGERIWFLAHCEHYNQGQLMTWEPGEGSPLKIADNVHEPVFISEDQRYIWWIGQSAGGDGQSRILQVAIDRSPSPFVSVENVDGIVGLSGDGARVWFSNNYDQEERTLSLHTLAIGEDAPSTIASGVLERRLDLFHDEDLIWFVEKENKALKLFKVGDTAPVHVTSNARSTSWFHGERGWFTFTENPSDEILILGTYQVGDVSVTRIEAGLDFYIGKFDSERIWYAMTEDSDGYTSLKTWAVGDREPRPVCGSIRVDPYYFIRFGDFDMSNPGTDRVWYCYRISSVAAIETIAAGETNPTTITQDAVYGTPPSSSSRTFRLSTDGTRLWFRFFQQQGLTTWALGDTSTAIVDENMEGGFILAGEGNRVYYLRNFTYLEGSDNYFFAQGTGTLYTWTGDSRESVKISDNVISPASARSANGESMIFYRLDSPNHTSIFFYKPGAEGPIDIIRDLVIEECPYVD